MEQLTDLQSIINTPMPLIEYAVVYNEDTGEVMRVGPNSAFANDSNKISIDEETALQIIEGNIRISACVVNIYTKELEIAEIKTAYKMDDVLHRIPDVRWIAMEDPEIYLTYDSNKKTITFELSTEFGGTRNTNKKITIIRKTVWDGDTAMNFLITEYNDPNILYEMITLNISELKGKAKIVKDITVPTKFSIYTRRLFKKYVMEIV